MTTTAIEKVLDFIFEDEKDHYEEYVSYLLDLDADNFPTSDEELYKLGRENNINHIWLDVHQAYIELQELTNAQL